MPCHPVGGIGGSGGPFWSNADISSRERFHLIPVHSGTEISMRHPLVTERAQSRGGASEGGWPRNAAANRCPHQFSRRRSQRLCISRALGEPRPDRRGRAGLNAGDIGGAAGGRPNADLRARDGLSFLCINQDPTTVDRARQRVVTMQACRITETGTKAPVLTNPVPPTAAPLLLSTGQSPARSPLVEIAPGLCRRSLRSRHGTSEGILTGRPRPDDDRRQKHRPRSAGNEKRIAPGAPPRRIDGHQPRPAAAEPRDVHLCRGH